MNLTIKDRLIIPLLLPKQGRLIEIQTVAGIMGMVKFIPGEINAYEIKDSPTGTTWNQDKAQAIDVSFLPEQISVLKSSVQKIDESGQVTFDMIETILKIQSL
jgi:hypothetical protein